MVRGSRQSKKICCRRSQAGWHLCWPVRPNSCVQVLPPLLLAAGPEPFLCLSFLRCEMRVITGSTLRVVYGLNRLMHMKYLDIGYMPGT